MISTKNDKFFDPQLPPFTKWTIDLLFKNKIIHKYMTNFKTSPHPSPAPPPPLPWRRKTLNCVKLGRGVTFMKYLASVVSVIFLPKTLIWNRIKFWLLNLLNLAELVVNELTKSIFKKIYNIPFSIRFITAYYKDFKSF